MFTHDKEALAVIVIMNDVLEWLAAHPAPVPNTVDMFDLQEGDYRTIDEDDCDDDEE